MNLFYKVFITILIIITLPLTVLVILLIVLTSGLPIIFSQKRVGKDGKPFMMYKFRTMVVDAEKQRLKYIRY